ncbi:unnamed protein product [Chondrus crispus]|uniref:Uncharacterized protein n=1 Tax=Chondrus crispus TaxID=2769 RepID=R7Q6E0_CHOCR|nr:unnamed protein product [Chondrus crispus]CDF33010.1 unnamed protein product [Chondrus crispus]|eukprot:XP_005712813.1 unnamed protein product [Chondrus crispus]
MKITNIKNGIDIADIVVVNRFWLVCTRRCATVLKFLLPLRFTLHRVLWESERVVFIEPT